MPERQLMSEQPIDPQDPGAGAPEDTPQAGGVTTADTLQKERDDLYDRLLRKTAEFDNFRKRVERDRKDTIEWAAADLISDLLSRRRPRRNRSRPASS
jgi:molecular chaperone GrpE